MNVSLCRSTMAISRQLTIRHINCITISRESQKMGVVVKDKVYTVKDGSSGRELELVLEQERSFGKDDTLFAQGEFRRGKNNPDGEPEKVWEIRVRADSADRVEKS